MHVQPNIGYACKTVGLRDMAMRACPLAAATVDRLLEVSLHNIAVLARMVAYNAAVDIKLFRISSDIIPLASHPEVRFDWRVRCADALAEVGRSIRETGLRVSMHPGQYTVLNSPDEDVASRAIADLTYHAEFLDSMGTDSQSKIVLHVGGVYGDRKAALERFARRFDSLPVHVARRVVLENDERCFAIHEVYALGCKLGIPVVMDVFHHALLPSPDGSSLDWLKRCGKTWKKRDGRQKIHYSEQLAGGKPGMHSRTIDAARFLDFHSGVSHLPLDIMLEVKDKNLSAKKCLNCVKQAARGVLTATWAEYKYAVLEHSPNHYRRIREYLKVEQPAAVGFYALIDEALAQEAKPGTSVNAALHVWGYFKHNATAAEKKRFEAGLARLSQAGHVSRVKRQLLAMSVKYEQEYLLKSLYFHL